MRLTRTALFGAVLLGFAVPAMAADLTPRLVGEINYQTYPAVAAFLNENVGKPVAFEVALPIDNEETDGHLTTFVLDGQFEIAYLAGEKTSRIYSDVGFDLVNDSDYTLDGVFTVTKGEADAEAPYLALDAVASSDGLTFQDVAIASLKAPAN